MAVMSTSEVQGLSLHLELIQPQEEDLALSSVREFAPPAKQPRPPYVFSQKKGGQSDIVDPAEPVAAAPGTGSQAWEACDSPSNLSRYADKGQGLSLAQRLRQLDLSDEEEEHEDGAFDRRKSLLSESEEPPEAETPSIVVEACQEFVQEADSDTE
ncbi:unnamed protein product [Effrenium voratum]|uniref:Uncharacterized protein n=1 Tax=Effrenium voratum TaxID=2562239 RepID=A0AA36J338_9DINO|nr:unnamed protein product [Effrenium voratum]CAJ1398717.1 unnamed protein product [Effrenium voratum]CAJ1427778.1 unnamed protein product [Effrenium voratum]